MGDKYTMPKKNLTDLFIKRLEPPPKKVIYFDTSYCQKLCMG